MHACSVEGCNVALGGLGMWWLGVCCHFKYLFCSSMLWFVQPVLQLLCWRMYALGACIHCHSLLSTNNNDGDAISVADCGVFYLAQGSRKLACC